MKARRDHDRRPGATEYDFSFKSREGRWKVKLFLQSPRKQSKIFQNAPAPDSTVDSGNLPAFLHVAMRRDLAVSLTAQRHSILARVQAIQTRAQAKQYINEVRAKIQAAEAIQVKP